MTVTDAQLDAIARRMDLDALTRNLHYPDACDPLSSLTMHAAEVGLFGDLTDQDVYCWAVPGGSHEGALARWITSTPQHPHLMLATPAAFPSEHTARHTNGRERARALLLHAHGQLAELTADFHRATRTPRPR